LTFSVYKTKPIVFGKEDNAKKHDFFVVFFKKKSLSLRQK